MGVLVYELGYVYWCYLMWWLIQSLVIVVMVILLFGDVLVVLVNILMVLLDLKYLCDIECEVDDYVIVMFKVNGLLCQKLVLVFEKLEDMGKSKDSLVVCYLFSYLVNEECIVYIFGVC